MTLDPTFGRVVVNYLTGQARAAGDTYLTITRQTISDGTTTYLRDTNAPLDLKLQGYQIQQARINVPFTITASGTADSKLFTDFLFDPSAYKVEDLDGSLTAQTMPDGLPVTLDARIRVFPGRVTMVPVFVSDATVSDSGFDTQLFKDQNYSTDESDPDGQGKLASRFSDFVRFDITNVPEEDRPNLRDESGVETGEKASYVYFSGDNYALSNATPGTGSFFQELALEFDNPVVGHWANSSAGGFPGTYDLRTADPTDVTGMARILATQGVFRNYTQVLSGGTTFEIVMFPNSGENYSFENDPSSGTQRGRLGDLVAIVRDGNNNITNMYFGGANLGTGRFELFPIARLGDDPSDTSGLIEGALSGYLDRNGAVTSDVKRVRRFTYTFDTGATLPTGFRQTGNATVLRI